MRFVNVLAILAMSGLGLTLFQNCSKARFADSNIELLEQSSLSESTIFINDNALYTNSANVRVQVNLEKPMWMYVTNDPTCASGGTWQNFAPEIPWVLGSKNKETSVYVKFKTDYTESGCSSDSIIHDDIIPTISQLGSVPAITNVAGVNIALNAADVGSGVDRIVCPDGVASCGNAVMVSNSDEGQRNAIFYSLDKAGNKSLPLTVSWLYDKTGPVIQLADKPGLTSKELNAAFRVTGQDNFTDSADLKYRRSLDGQAFVDVNSTFSVPVAEGAHTILIEAVDKAGNKSNAISYSWTVGTKVPSVIFTKTPKDYDNTPGSFEFTGEDQFKAPLVKYECSLNGAAYSVCSSPVVLSAANLKQGANSFSVRGTDALEMVGEKSHTWIYDSGKPVLKLVKVPKEFSNSSAEEVQVSVEGETNLSSIEFIIDGVSKQKSLLNNYVMSGLVEAKHSIQVVAADKAGNVSDPVNYSFWSDFTAPSVTIGALADYSSNRNQLIDIQGTDNNTDPKNILKYYYELDGSAIYTQVTLLPLQLLNLENGRHQISVYAVDMAGNKSVIVPSESIYIDLNEPTISIIKKPADNMATGSYSIINFVVSDVGAGVKAGSLVCSLSKGGVAVNFGCASGQDLSILNDVAANYQFDISVKDNLDQEATAKINWVAAQMFIGKTTMFNVSQIVNSDVDILFLVGNDQAMGPVLTKIGNAFNGFMQKIQGLNWRLAITTADSSGNNAGSNGNILMFNNSAYYITPDTANAEALFKDRLNVGTNQAAKANKEKALTVTHQFLNKVFAAEQTREKEFYRPGAVLVTIIVSHRDEVIGDETPYTSSSVFLNGDASKGVVGLYQRLGENKSYLNHSSVVLDQDCANQSAYSYIGTTYIDVARDTGGINASICSDNYTTQMNNFGNAILTKVSQIQLECTPVDEHNDGQLDVSISLTIDGSVTQVPKSDYQVVNNVVRFLNPPSTVGDYKVSYTCLSWEK